MRLIFLSNKWILYGLILILLIVLIVLTKIAFLPTNNLPTKNITSTPKTIDLCAPFPIIKGEINCEEAIKRATTDTKGSIKNITIGFFPLSRALERTPVNSKKQMWLIDIELERSFVASNGAAVNSLRIGIPVDGTDALYRIPIKP